MLARFGRLDMDISQTQPHELFTLTVLALSRTSYRRTSLARMLSAANYRIPRARRTAGQRAGEAPSATNLRPMLTRWAEAKWVDEFDDQWMLVADRFDSVLTYVSRQDPNLIRTAEAIATHEARYEYGPKPHLVAARAALYFGDVESIESALRQLNAFNRLPKSAPLPFVDVFTIDEIETWVERGPSSLQIPCLEQAFAVGSTEGIPFSERLAAHALALDGPAAASVQAAACTFYDLQDVETELGGVVEARSDGASLEAMAVRAMLRGEFAQAQAEIERAWAASVGSGKRRKPRLEGPLAPLMTFVAAVGPPQLQAIAAQQLKSPAARGFAAARYEQVAAALYFEDGVYSASFKRNDWASLVQVGLLTAWAESPLPDDTVRSLSEILRLGSEGFDARGFAWPAEQLAVIARAVLGKPAPKPAPSLLDLRVKRAPWEAALDAIEGELAQVSTLGSDTAADERLIWQVEITTRAPSIHDLINLPFVDAPPQTGRRAPLLQVAPRLQKRRKNGWSKGRAVALRRLVEQSEAAPWMTAHDRRVVDTITFHREYYERFYDFTDATPIALVGHPAVYWASDDEQPVEVVRGEPALIVDRRPGNELRLAMEPEPPSVARWCEKTGSHRITVYNLTDAQRRLADRIGVGLVLPAQAEDRLQCLVTKAASLLPVHTDLLAETETAELRDAESRPVVEIDRLQAGIRVRFAVFPLGLSGPRVHTGFGNTALVATVDNQLVRCERDLTEESSRLDDLRDRCPSLRRGEQAGEHIDLTDVYDALEALSELHALEDDAQLVWKKGKPLSVSDECGEAALRMAVRAEASEWFAASGDLEVDDSLVVGLRVLLDALPSRRGRYVPLDESRYLALSESLLSKLHALSAAKADPSDEAPDDEDLSLHPVIAGMVAGWGPQLKAVDIDKKSKKQLKRAQEAAQLSPTVPLTLEAELRPYQQEGFQWLARLAHWGAGACLADDMGLGKTVQALALLLHRAELGPALVVAPTSVCSGWAQEAARFAPTLRCVVLAGAPDPSATWSPFDVIVVSHTMMANHIERLADVAFATVILDEAQAIKNAATQRAKAARQLKGAFRIALTGTPVENHLGELWSLMSFLNPGLLGTAKQFDRRFGRGLNKDEGPERMEQLKSLMAPFILRRRKRDVLRELPPRTEVVVEIEPSAEERAFSEALRQRALERLQEREDVQSSAMTILAELTRLRQAACHPALVDPDIGLRSSKLDHLVELARDLIEGGHRMLVFSQFVAFLSYVREYFDEAGIRYQYLDGATPRADRDRAVRQFQAGHADAFIISLKAGGTGLNLTAADYVIHLDPWWNPAVDDQASSRAHRMGQTRPVTVYKLIAKGSIEEKVYALHHDKRDLAERLLAGADTGQTPSLETLLALLDDR